MESSKIYLKEIEKQLYDCTNKYNINENFVFHISKHPNFDVQCNNFVKFKNLEKTLKNLIEQEITENSFIEVCEFGNNNFLNIKFSEEYIQNCLKKNQNFSFEEVKTVLLDYGGFNIGKALHVGHIRSLNIGRSLYNTLKFVGYKPISDIHYGDWGVQMAQIVAYIIKNEIDLKTIKLSDLDAIYPKASLLSREDNIFSSLVSNVLQNLNKKNDKEYKIWKEIYNLSTREIENILSTLGYRFDQKFGESDVIDIIPDLLAKFDALGLTEIDDGALIASDKQEPPAILVKSDGTYVYLTTDIGTVVNREANYKNDLYIYITDQRQSLHFKQLFKLVDYLSLSNSEFKHVGFGTVNDGQGKPLKTRDGGVYKLVDLFTEVEKKLESKNTDKKIAKNLAKSILTYSDLVTKRVSDYNFDLEKFTNINGKSAIYLQYAQVRAKKLLDSKVVERNFYNFNEDERTLALEIINFSYALEQTVKTLEPHHIAEYGYSLAQKFNIFYKNNKILTEELDLKTSTTRLSLVEAFHETILNVFYCLGLDPVDTM